MRKSIIVLFMSALAVMPALPMTRQESKACEAKQTVYVCTGPKSKRFHSSQSCRGLRNCSGQVVKMSKTDAQKAGYTPCKICY